MRTNLRIVLCVASSANNQGALWIGRRMPYIGSSLGCSHHNDIVVALLWILLIANKGYQRGLWATKILCQMYQIVRN